MKQLICIVCPKGCHISIDEKDDFKVTGASCTRGEEYGKIECTNPTRMVTSTVAIENASQPRLSVKTNIPIAKSDIFKVINSLEDVLVTSPVNVGDIIVKNVAGTNADIVATRKL